MSALLVCPETLGTYVRGVNLTPGYHVSLDFRIAMLTLCCYSIMSRVTLILVYHASMLTLQTP